MAYQKFGGFNRQMYFPKEGETWQCADCGSNIEKLPFEPDPSRINQLRCRKCHQKRKPFKKKF